MSYTITRKLDGQHLARFQIQDGFVEHTCAHLESAFAWPALEADMERDGLLRRSPNRRTTGGRRFFKAELTFWGVILGIIRKHGRSYVVPGVGLDFDWPRIVDLVTGSGASL